MKRHFEVIVRYRTNSGCNAKRVTVEADTVYEALQLASDKVRRMRGVVRIDGGEWSEVKPVATTSNLTWAKTEAKRRAKVMDDAYSIYQHKRNIDDYMVRNAAAAPPDPTDWQLRGTVQPDGSYSFLDGLDLHRIRADELTGDYLLPRSRR